MRLLVLTALRRTQYGEVATLFSFFSVFSDREDLRARASDVAARQDDKVKRESRSVMELIAAQAGAIDEDDAKEAGLKTKAHDPAKVLNTIEGDVNIRPPRHPTIRRYIQPPQAEDAGAPRVRKVLNPLGTGWEDGPTCPVCGMIEYKIKKFRQVHYNGTHLFLRSSFVDFPPNPSVGSTRQWIVAPFLLPV